jgi:hypothetical protein
MHKTKDEDKQNKTHNTICVGHHNTEDKDEDKKKHTTKCVGHHHTQHKRRRPTKQITQHNMCWTTPYTRKKTKTNKPKNTTQYVLDTTIHKKKDEDK